MAEASEASAVPGGLGLDYASSSSSADDSSEEKNNKGSKADSSSDEETSEESKTVTKRYAPKKLSLVVVWVLT